MLNDAELQRLRDLWSGAAIAPINHRSGGTFEGWDSMVCDPNESTIRAFFHDVDTPMEVNTSVFDCVASIGMAVASDLLNGAPLPLDDVRDRRWQLRRQLENIVAGMNDEQVQRLVYWARSIAQ